MSEVGGAAGAAAYHFNQHQASCMRGVEVAVLSKALLKRLNGKKVSMMW